MSDDNMKLWDSVFKTDPKYTKRLTHGAKLTAVSAMYQVRCATEQFGAAGVGWGWRYSDPIFPPNGTVVLMCTLWHGTKDQTVQQFGQVRLGDSSRPDEDALKKAGTDGLTKCLSYLGFNADVFMGMFDDNKYVNELKKEMAEDVKPKPNPRINELFNKLSSEMISFDDGAKFKAWWSVGSLADRDVLKKLSLERHVKLIKDMKIQATKFTVPSPSNLIQE